MRMHVRWCSMERSWLAHDNQVSDTDRSRTRMYAHELRPLALDIELPGSTFIAMGAPVN